jgi:hypothetical protein
MPYALERIIVIPFLEFGESPWMENVIRDMKNHKPELDANVTTF